MRRYRILKRLKPDYVNRRKIIAFDVETNQIQRKGYIEQEFLCGSVVSEYDYFFTDKVKELADHILQKKFKNHYIFATNLEFDFMHVFQHDRRIQDMFMIDKNGIIYCCYKKEREGRIIEGKDYKKFNKWHFLDTWNFTGKMSLKAMGKMIGLNKFPHPKFLGHAPKNNSEKKIIRDYNIRDSEITYHFAKFIIHDFCNMLKCKAKLTIASTGQDYWRRHSQPVDIFQEPRHIINKHYEGSMHGGRTECFIRGLVFDAFYYDYNSHYPAICYEGVDGDGSYPNPSSYKYSKDITLKIIKNYEGVTKIRVKAPDMHIPVLGITNEDNKYIFPIGIFSGWFTNYEIREALKHGYSIEKIHEGIYYTRLFKPFREAVENLFDLRDEYKKQGNIIMSQMCKVMMNAGLFGKFAQKIDNKTVIHHDKDIYADENGYLYVKIKDSLRKLTDFNIRGKFYFEKIKNPLRIPIFILPILASYTTGMARIKLFNAMNRYPSDIIYCDTDSIVMQKSRFESSKKLGKLQLEHRIKKAIFVKPKLYYLNNGVDDIIKSKGIGKFLSGKEQFYDFLNEPKVRTERFTKLKESFVRKLPFSSIIDVNKCINLEDDKRVWEKPFNYFEEQYSSPLNIAP